MPVWSDALDVDQKTVAVLGDSGIVLGLEDEHGCRWFWESSDPWSPSPSVRAVTGPRATDDGEWDATRFYGPRQPDFKGIVVAPTHRALHAAKQRLFDAVTVEPFPLRVVEPGFDRYAIVRRGGEVLWTEMKSTISATYSLSLYAPDPTVYNTTASELVTSLATAAHTVENGGGRAASPTVTIAGQTSDKIVLTNATTGRSMTIQHPTPGTPVVAAGQSLVIDMRARTIKTGTGTSRRSWMTGKWWTLARGTNALTLNALAGTGSAGTPSGLTVDWREGWI